MTKSKQSNARGGPKTEEGKKHSSQNSIKAGAYSRELVLPQESVEEFELLYETFVSDLKPQDIVGFTLVRDLVGIAWKQMRLDRYEAKVLIDILNAPIRKEEYRGTAYLWREDIQDLMPAIHDVNPEFAKGAASALIFANSIKGLELSAELEQEIKDQYPVLDEFLNEKIFPATVAGSPKEMQDNILPTSMLGQDDSPFVQKLQLAIEELKKIVWLFHHKDALLKEHQMIQQRRLLEFMERPGGSRVHDDLRRSFAKTMSEYRKHEEWRLERSMLDMGEALID